MTKDIYKVCPSQKELDAKDKEALEQPVVKDSLTVQKPLSEIEGEKHMNKDEALKLVIEWFDIAQMDLSESAYRGALPIIEACKEALQPESPPEHSMTYEDGFAHGYDAYLADYKEQPTQKPLSDKEIRSIAINLNNVDLIEGVFPEDLTEFARAIEKRILARYIV